MGWVLLLLLQNTIKFKDDDNRENWFWKAFKDSVNNTPTCTVQKVALITVKAEAAEDLETDWVFRHHVTYFLVENSSQFCLVDL